MSEIEELKRYTERRRFKNALEIPAGASVDLAPLASGEYNANYIFDHPLTGKKLVLRVNKGSQMHLEDQIGYEFRALKIIEPSRRTPRAIFVDGSREHLPNGVMVMEFLEGSPLVYERDIDIAAEILADIHSVPVGSASGLSDPGEPLGAIVDECEAMAAVYLSSPRSDLETARTIERLLARGREMASSAAGYGGYRCCVNTELNSGNFLIKGHDDMKDNHLVDWEKPIFGEPAQDLGHFLAPTTTFWKTDTILSAEEISSFVDLYVRAVGGRFDASEVRERTELFIPITCLRGITWCAMAKIEYGSPDRELKNEYTARKIDSYLSKDLLQKIEREHLDIQGSGIRHEK